MAYILRRRKLGRTSCRMISALSKTGITVVRNDGNIPSGEAQDLVFRWGCTSDVPQRNVVNTSKAIHLASNKAQYRKILLENKLCQATWFSFDDFIRGIGEVDGGELVIPVIVRRHQHHQGRNLHFCKTIQEVRAACAKYPGNHYISNFIDKVAEYRIFVISGRAVCVASKVPADKNSIAWNVYQGGEFKNVRWDDWPLKSVKIGIKAWELSGLDFGGVDVMVDKDGEVYVLEINSAPSLTSPYRQECFAKAFDYIVKHGKNQIQLTEERGGYLKFIHPAINENARI